MAGLATVSTVQAQVPNPKLRPKIQIAPKTLDLSRLRADLAKGNYHFQVGDTGLLGFDIPQLTGDILPTNIVQIARDQEPISRSILEIDRQARESAVRINPSLRARLYEFNIVASPSMKRWDWRAQGKVSPIRNQNPAGTCWAFSVVGALESAWKVRNGESIDGSEQFLVSYSGAGNTAGGDRTKANDYLRAQGTALETACPYNATNSTPTPASASTPYELLTWGLVDSANALPSVEAIKEALCAHGPLEIGIYADDNLKVYSGGIFDHVDPAKNGSNHAILLVGWDDAKNSWIVRNSWGTGWGETCGYGSEKGYGYIKYGAHNVGYRAMWVKAKAKLYTIDPALLKAVPLNPNIKLNLNLLKK